MSAGKTKQPADGGVFTAEDYWFLGKTMALSYQHALRRRAAAAGVDDAAHERGDAFVAAHGSETPLSERAKSALRWALRSNFTRTEIQRIWGDEVSAELKAFTAESQNDQDQLLAESERRKH